MKQSNNLQSKIINLNFKENDYKFNTEIIKPLNIFYNEVCAYLQIEPNKFELYYNNKKLSINNKNNITLSNVIGTNDEPFFKIIPKVKKAQTPFKLNLRYDESIPEILHIDYGTGSITFKCPTHGEKTLSLKDYFMEINFRKNLNITNKKCLCSVKFIFQNFQLIYVVSNK